MRREDVVDLALQHYTCDEVLARARAIQEQHDTDYLSMPAFMATPLAEPMDVACWRNLEPLSAMLVVSLRNGRRATELLLQRILIRRAGATSGRLIGIARAVFADVLQVALRHDVASVMQASYNFLLGSHGLRSAAILAIELLKQELMPAYPEDPLLPRSRTVQDLAVFAARLGAVDPSDGCYSVCEQGKRVITKILDRILSPGIVEVRRDGGGGGGCDVLHHTEPLQTQAQEVFPIQAEMGAPQSNMLGSVNGMVLGVPDMGYMMEMMDVGIGIEAPMSLGQDIDFMRLIEGMDWERSDNWSARM